MTVYEFNNSAAKGKHATFIYICRKYLRERKHLVRLVLLTLRNSITNNANINSSMYTIFHNLTFTNNLYTQSRRIFVIQFMVISSIQYLIVWHILVGSDTITDNDITINYKTYISGCTPHNGLLSFFCIISTDDDLISMGNTICHIRVFAEAPTMPGDTSAYYANIMTQNVLITSLMVGLIRVENVTGRTVQRLCFMSLHSLTHWVQAWFRWNNCRNRWNHFKKGQ